MAKKLALQMYLMLSWNVMKERKGYIRWETWRARDNNKMRKGTRKRDQHVLLCYYETPFFTWLQFYFVHTHYVYIWLSFLCILCLPPSVCCSQSYNPASFLNAFLITIYTYQYSSELYVCIHYLRRIMILNWIMSVGRKVRN